MCIADFVSSKNIMMVEVSMGLLGALGKIIHLKQIKQQNEHEKLMGKIARGTQRVELHLH